GSLFFLCSCCFLYFFFNDTATTRIYPLSLHDALPILLHAVEAVDVDGNQPGEPVVERELDGDTVVVAVEVALVGVQRRVCVDPRSEEHTSELQSPYDLVCRLLLEKKKHYIHVT